MSEQPIVKAGQGRYHRLLKELQTTPKTWLVTGVAGFIGSNLMQVLLTNGQTVVGLDDFSTGSESNIDEVLSSAGNASKQFRLITGDIRQLETCRAACEGVDYVLHEAALGSVPRSINDPVTSTQVNVNGFLHVLVAARDAGVKRVVYASSSSVYGDNEELPQSERRTGNPLSPYAVTKSTNESFARVFQRTYGLEVIGLRYFNVFGQRQDPNGAYAAVIPRWIGNLLHDEPCQIFGDGETSRDFCYVANVVQANLLAAVSSRDATQAAYNIACGESTSLTRLFYLIRDGLAAHVGRVKSAEPQYGDFRSGDIARSLASIEMARSALGYEPTHRLADGLAETLNWYVDPQTRTSAVR